MYLNSIHSHSSLLRQIMAPPRGGDPASPAGQAGRAREGRARAEAATCWTSRTRHRGGEGRRQAGALDALWQVPKPSRCCGLPFCSPQPSTLLRIPGPVPSHSQALAAHSAAQSLRWRASWETGLNEAGVAFRTQLITRTGLGTACALALPCMEAPGNPTYRQKSTLGEVKPLT